jgi:hypothetical protein
LPRRRLFPNSAPRKKLRTAAESFALAQGARRTMGDDGESNAESEPVMGLYILDVVFRISGIRGHIPRHGGFRGGGGGSPFAGNSLMWVLAAAVVSVAVLALVPWTAVWLAIKLI